MTLDDLQRVRQARGTPPADWMRDL